MLDIIYEDRYLITAVKPPGMAAQAERSFEPDMVSEIRRHIYRQSPEAGTPYVGVVHRLDRPVGGILVYAKDKRTAAALSTQLRQGCFRKIYRAVLCGKPPHFVDNYVDYLLKDGTKNFSRLVGKGEKGAKRAELSFRILGERDGLCLAEIHLVTGRHHQIRVQMAGHGTPIWGDSRYNPAFAGRRTAPALAAVSLAFTHPVTGKEMYFERLPEAEIFDGF